MTAAGPVMLPIEIPIVFGDEELDVLGGMLGSSDALIGELELVAPALGIDATRGITPAQARALVDDRDGPFARERTAWLALYANATASVRFRTAMVFHHCS